MLLYVKNTWAVNCWRAADDRPYIKFVRRTSYGFPLRGSCHEVTDEVYDALAS